MIELRGMTWDHPRGIDPLVAHARQYESRHRVHITWDARSLEEFEAKGLDALAAEYDLIVIDHPHVGMAAASGCLLPFDPSIHFDTVGRSHESYHYAGRQWALAIDAAAQVSARRAGDLDHWPDAQELSYLCGERRVVCPLTPVHALMLFFTSLAGACTPCFTESEQLIDPVVGATCLERLRKFASSLPRFCFEQSPIGILETMSTDSRYVYCPYTYGYVTYARDGFRRTRIEFGDIPGTVGSTLGGTGVAISARTRYPEAATLLATDLASPQTQRGVYASAGGQPAHCDAWDDLAVNRATHDFYINTRATLDASWIRPRFDGYIGFQAKAGEMVAACLKGQLHQVICIDQLNTLFAEAQRRK